MQKILLINLLLTGQLVFASLNEDYKNIQKYISSGSFNIETLNTKIKELQQNYADDFDYGWALWQIADTLFEQEIYHPYIVEYLFEASNRLLQQNETEQALIAYNRAIEIENLTFMEELRNTAGGSPELRFIFAAPKLGNGF